MKPLISIVALLIVTLSAQVAIAHPSDGWPTRELHPNYGDQGFGWNSTYNWGDFQFYAPYPQPAFLTDHEKYMLAGTSESGLDQGQGLLPWIDQIVTLIELCYTQTGRVPSTLNDTALAEAMGTDANMIDPLVLDIVRSPISNRYPRLDSKQNSPGDLFVKVLSTEEAQYFAQFNRALDDLINRGVVWDSTSGSEYCAQLAGPVLYVRVYGENRVIYSNITFSSSYEQW